MNRRELLKRLAASAALGVSGCTLNQVELLQGIAPSASEAWNRLPPQVQAAFSNNPALSGAPQIGIASTSVRAGSQGEMLVDWEFEPIGPLYYRRLGHRTSTYTSPPTAFGSLMHPLGLEVACYQTNYDDNDNPNGFSSLSSSCVAVKADGSFALRVGSEAHATMTLAGLDPAGRPNGPMKVVEQQVNVTNKIGTLRLWRDLILGKTGMDVPPWMLFEDSFLMGNFYEIVKAETDQPVRTTLYSEVYGIIVLNTQNDDQAKYDDDRPIGKARLYLPTGQFGVLQPDASHMKGARFALNAIGIERLRNARIALEAELVESLSAASFLGADRQAAAEPILARGRQLWAAGQWDASMRTLDEGLEIDPRHPASLVLYADAMRRNFKRPSVQALAADRLARLKLRMALALDPEGPAGHAAQTALSSLPA